LSALKGKISRQIGIPLTKSGREKKMGRMVGEILGAAPLLIPPPPVAQNPTRRPPPPVQPPPVQPPPLPPAFPLIDTRRRAAPPPPRNSIAGLIVGAIVVLIAVPIGLIATVVMIGVASIPSRPTNSLQSSPPVERVEQSAPHHVQHPVADHGHTHHVKGYYRKNGTYVQPHERSNPNGTKSDNLRQPKKSKKH